MSKRTRSIDMVASGPSNAKRTARSIFGNLWAKIYRARPVFSTAAHLHEDLDDLMIGDKFELGYGSGDGTCWKVISIRASEIRAAACDTMNMWGEYHVGRWSRRQRFRGIILDAIIPVNPRVPHWEIPSGHAVA
jgi:hypothetical protein